MVIFAFFANISVNFGPMSLELKGQVPRLNVKATVVSLFDSRPGRYSTSGQSSQENAKNESRGRTSGLTSVPDRWRLAESGKLLSSLVVPILTEKSGISHLKNLHLPNCHHVRPNRTVRMPPKSMC